MTDILGYGGYHGDDIKNKRKLRKQPENINLYISADDLIIPASSNSGMSSR